MFTELSLSYIFFRVLNVGVIIALGVYFFKRYGVYAIVQGMKEQERYKKELAEQQERLVREQHALEARAREQVLFADRLEKNIQIWRAQFDEQVARVAQQKEVLRAALARKSAQQQQQLEADIVARSVLSGAVEKARQQLLTIFSQEKTGKAFVNDIIAYVKTRCI